MIGGPSAGRGRTLEDMADVHSKLDELSAAVEHAKAVPLSASCVVHRAELLAAIDAIRRSLPAELAAADDVLRDRADVVARGQAEADEIIAAATAERDRLVSDHEIAQAAAREAAAIRAAAEAEAATMRREVEDYVDGKLANFEVVLHKTIVAVGKGRDKLRGRLEAGMLADTVEQADPAADTDEGAGGPARAVVDLSGAAATSPAPPTVAAAERR